MSSSVIFLYFFHNFLIILSEATIKERMTEQLPIVSLRSDSFTSQASAALLGFGSVGFCPDGYC